MNVATRCLDWLAIEASDLSVKIDVEGLELEVLKGAEGLFREGRIRAVYIDCYDDAAVRDLLVAQGFALYDAMTLLPAKAPQQLLALRH